MEIAACIKFQHQGNDDLALKKALLVFDRVHFILPSFIRIDPKVIGRRSKVIVVGDDKIQYGRKFNMFRDTVSDMYLASQSLKDHKLKEIIEEFEGAGILKEADQKELIDSSFNSKLSRRLIELQCQDKKILGLPEHVRQVNFEFRTNTIVYESDNEPGKKHRMYQIVPPDVVQEAHEIIQSMFFADFSKAYPLFTTAAQLDAASLRIGRFEEIVPQLEKIAPDLFERYRTRSKFLRPVCRRRHKCSMPAAASAERSSVGMSASAVSTTV